MSDIIQTRYQRAGFSNVDEIVLHETSRTRTVFCPSVHDGGVRGSIVRQKRGANGEWATVSEVDFRSVAPDCGVKMELNTAATLTLYKKLDQLYSLQSQGAPRSSQRYVVVPEDQIIVVDDESKHEVIQQLLDKGYSEEFWRALSRDQPDLAAQLAAAKIQFDREEAINEFEGSLTAYAADESYWQEFFEQHPWMLQSAFSSPVFMLNGETYSAFAVLGVVSGPLVAGV